MAATPTATPTTLIAAGKAMIPAPMMVVDKLKTQPVTDAFGFDLEPDAVPSSSLVLLPSNGDSSFSITSFVPVGFGLLMWWLMLILCYCYWVVGIRQSYPFFLSLSLAAS